MSTKEERLAKYRRAQDPSFDILAKIPMIKGEPGKDAYTPQKGVDYFTAGEIDAIVAYIQSKIRNGIDGKDSVVPGPQGEPGKSIQGKPGYTPVRGVDFWTEKDVQTMIKEVLKLLPKPEKTKALTMKEIMAELKKNPVHYKDLHGAPDLTDLPKLIEFLKRGGFRGGGGSSTGGGFTLLTATETPNGVLTTFTFATATAQPSFIISDNAMMQATTKAGGVNWTWNAGTLQATLTIPPIDDVIAVK